MPLHCRNMLTTMYLSTTTSCSKKTAGNSHVLPGAALDYCHRRYHSLFVVVLLLDDHAVRLRVVEGHHQLVDRLERLIIIMVELLHADVVPE